MYYLYDCTWYNSYLWEHISTHILQNAYISKRHPTRQEGILGQAPSLVNPVWTRHSFYHTWFVHVLYGTLTLGRTLIFLKRASICRVASPQTGRLLMRIWRLLVKSSAYICKSTRSFIHGNLDHPFGLTEHLLITELSLGTILDNFQIRMCKHNRCNVKPISATLLHFVPTPLSLSNMLIHLLCLYLLPVHVDE